METSNFLTAERHVRALFLTLASELGASAHISSQWADRLVSHYREPQRYYHTLSHISSMLSLLTQHEGQIKNVPAVKLAIFFHDIIYDPKAKDNEIQSVQCFRLFAGDLGLAPDATDIVVESIERTITHTLSTRADFDAGKVDDLRFFLDFDLEVLSRGEAEYAEYATQIRKEYGHFSERDYCAGRIGVLESFLKREQLYFSNEFHERGEVQARQNIEREIKSLQGRLVAGEIKF